MISVEMTPDQFTRAKENMSKAGAELTDTHIHTAEFDADFEYKEHVNGGSLIFTNEVEHYSGDGQQAHFNFGTLAQQILAIIGDLSEVFVAVAPIATSLEGTSPDFGEITPTGQIPTPIVKPTINLDEQKKDGE